MLHDKTFTTSFATTPLLLLQCVSNYIVSQKTNNTTHIANKLVKTKTAALFITTEANSINKKCAK